MTPSAKTDTKEAEDAASKTAGEEAASQEANTYYETGRACLYGLNGQKIDLEAAGDNPYAQLALYFSFDYDSVKAQELYEAVIEDGYMEGYLGFASIADAGGDYDTAFEYYNNVLEGEEQIYIAYTMYCTGYMYQHGDGVEPDYAKAMEWYEKAADLGNATAMDNIGWLYENGLGVEKDLFKAQEWYDKAAAAE